MSAALPPGLLEDVLTRLGFATVPAPDHDGLAALYLAWCRRVPFDNVRKLIALADPEAAGARLPGGTADDFFRAWVDHGTGGTCWPSANALHVLLASCGFSSRRVAASMGETGQPSHGTTVVTFAGGEHHEQHEQHGRDEHLVDTSMLTDEPVPLDRAAPTSTDHPLFGTRAEPVAEGWRFEFPEAMAPGPLPCRTLSPDAVDLPFFLARYEVSRGWSPFNVDVNARRNIDDAIIGYGGGKRAVHTAHGIDEAPLTGAALHDALIDELGLSEAIVDRLFSVWVAPPPS